MLFFFLLMGQAKNVDALLVYFGEDPSLCLYEQGTSSSFWQCIQKSLFAFFFTYLVIHVAAVTATLLSFIRSFKKAHEENIKQEELEKNEKAAKEVEMEKKDSNS